jgi:hypothetical protein
MTGLIRKFTNSPTTVEAFEWDGKHETIESPNIRLFMANNPYFKGEHGSLYIHTVDGVVEARPGDFIVKGVTGEVFPCKPNIFWKTYEEILPDIELKSEVKEEQPKEEPKKEEVAVKPENPVEKPKKSPEKKKATGEIPDKFKEDIKSLEEHCGPLDELKGDVLEIDLQELNKICPRVFVKAKSYMGLVGYLKKAYEIELRITSQRSK